MDKLSPKFWVITLMVFAAAFVRLIPHPPNFAPIAAMALFGGAYFSKKWAAFLVPIAAMFRLFALPYPQLLYYATSRCQYNVRIDPESTFCGRATTSRSIHFAFVPE